MRDKLKLIINDDPERADAHDAIEPQLARGEAERAGAKVGFNGLTPSEWASLSKNVWNDLSSPRNKYQLEHGAVFPLKLADRLIRMYSKEGDYVLDPFAGIGTTLVAAQYLGRNAFGTELNPRYAELAKQWLDEGKTMFEDNYFQRIVNDDCSNIARLFGEIKFQLTVTSPPYADFIHKSIADRATTHKKSAIKYENNSTVKPYSTDERDFGNLPYDKFLVKIRSILEANYFLTKTGGYSAWVVKDYRDTKNKIPYVPFHSDLARVGEEAGFKFHDLIIWDQTGQRRLVLLGYPSVLYTNQNCSFIVIFRKVR
jgi:DNA modification methylase